VFGTAAHSWVQAFPSELEAFRALQELLGPSAVYLVDTYDTLEGTRRAVSLGKPMWGVRLDSGNLVELSRAVRSILDEAGFRDAKIMVTGDLNEYKILELLKEHLPIDAFGVGTELATSADAPHVGAVYKLVETASGGSRRYTAKFSEDKQTMPGAKQVFRYQDHDLVGRSVESPSCTDDAEPADVLLEPVVVDGELVEEPPRVQAARERAASSLEKLPAALRSLFPVDPPYAVEYSDELRTLSARMRRELAEIQG
jgi:nicotinate phosphoribosyltransferase